MSGDSNPTQQESFVAVRPTTSRPRTHAFWLLGNPLNTYLETVALAANQDQSLSGLGRELEDGNPAWGQQQELLAHGKNPGSAAGTVQRMVESARLGQR